MQYRQHQGFRISEVGIGCYALSGVYGSKDREAFKQMLRRSYDLGVNFYDAAEAYGDAENILGETVRPFRDEIYIATKVGVREGLEPNLSAQYVHEACERSLAQLQTDWIDLYQIHFDDPQTPVEETLTALEDLVRAGKIRRYGLGHLPEERIEQYMQQGSIFSVLMELSAVERGNLQRQLSLCRQYGTAAIAFSTTGRGLLTGRFNQNTTFETSDLRHLDPLFQRERFTSGLRIARRIEEVGKKYGKTPAQTAIAWVLSQPGVVCALTGPSTIEHLEENLGGSGWALDADDLSVLETFFADEQAALSRAQRASVSEILNGALPADPSRAFIDLVYAVETSIVIGLAPEKKLMPTFYGLFALRKELDQKESLIKLEQVRSQLLDLIPLD